MKKDNWIDLNHYFEYLDVSIWKGNPVYNPEPPFHPHKNYPEYAFTEHSISPNPAYDGLRQCFRLLGLDRENYNQQTWNPLGDLIQPGNRVVIKPNFVLSNHAEGGNIFSIITHPSLLRAIVDYAYLALRGNGEIIIANSPQMDCNFFELLEITQLQTIQLFYEEKLKFNVPILDLRNFWIDLGKSQGIAYFNSKQQLSGDPMGHLVIKSWREKCI